jgi:hypothetical protein
MGGGSTPLTALKAGQGTLRMTEPIDRKTEARKRNNPEGSADGAEAMSTPQQRAVIERYLKQRDSRPGAPRLIVESKPDQPLTISEPSSADSAGLALAFGTTEAGVTSILLDSLINAACDGTPGNPTSEQDVNGVVAAVHGIGANDEIEAMLAVQMVATHFAATRALRRLKGSDTVPQQDSNGNLAVKLLRTFAAQTEALQRYRGKVQQKVTVEHVHVHTGGQAIVGSMNQSRGGGIMTKTEDNPMHLKTREPSRLRQAPRCLARTRRGTPCQSPAVAGETRFAECMAARPAVERQKGSATGNIVTEASLPRRSMNEGVSRH